MREVRLQPVEEVQMIQEKLLNGHEFPRTMLGGYATEGVDKFVSQMQERISELKKEIAEHYERSDLLKAEFASHNDELKRYHEREKALVNALLVAEERRDAVIAEMEREQAAEKAQAEKIVADARTEAAEETAKGAQIISDAQAQVEAMKKQSREEAEPARPQPRAAAAT